MVRFYPSETTKSAAAILMLIILSFSQPSCKSSKMLIKQLPLTIEPRSSWNALPAKQYTQQIPVRITVHHEGTRLEMGDDVVKKINAIQRWGMGADKKWADIPYHFLIAPDGTIFEGRNAFTVGETSTEYDPAGHLLICCLGNRETDPVPEAQLESLVKLIVYSSKKFNIPVDSLGTHKDHSTQTTCPGKYLYQYFQDSSVYKRVKANM